MAAPIVVLKFGSSVLPDSSRFSAVVHEIYRCYRRGNNVIVVVSAIGRHTDLLYDEAQRIVNPVVSDSALAQLLSTGELQSAALLTMALHRAGIPSELIDVTTACLVLGGERLDASPLNMDIDTVRTKLAATPVLVLPGFMGRHELGGTALMGRGGSDLTAVFLADQLGAEQIYLVKDVDGIYERDPAKDSEKVEQERAHRYGAVTYEEALRVAEGLVQPKAIEYLKQKRNTAHVSALLHDDGTVVGAASTTIADATQKPPLKVLLLGLGEVGQGVYAHLQQLPEFFEVVGIYVRDPHKVRGGTVPSGLLDTDLDELLERSHDLVVDVCGDHRAASGAIENRLLAGCPVVTANKRLAADRGSALQAIAAKAGTNFKYSAAVGGSTPMLERVQQVAALGEVSRLRGVINGTCNYVLDRMADGLSFEEAVVEAQQNGFAESDVERDLSGKDSADKLRILARVAFGVSNDGLPVFREGLQVVTPKAVQLAKARGQVIRLVATIDADGMARVAPESLPANDFLAGTRGEENRLIINGAAGRSWQVSGKGAGRWPTAEAIIADMLDIRANVVIHAKPLPDEVPRATLHSGRMPPLQMARQQGE